MTERQRSIDTIDTLVRSLTSVEEKLDIYRMELTYLYELRHTTELELGVIESKIRVVQLRIQILEKCNNLQNVSG